MRTLWAALLTLAALAALAGGWIATGWRGVSREAAALERAPAERAARRAAELAGELGARLEALRARESERPYFHYQNLYRDPKGAAEGAAVTPSPLAEGAPDPLIATHFQLDERGMVSLPSLNEELPELSDPVRLEASRAALAALRGATAELRPLAEAVAWAGPERAVASPPAPAPRPEPRPRPPIAANARRLALKDVSRIDSEAVLRANNDDAQVVRQTSVGKVEQLDPDIYAQNRAPNAVFLDLKQKKTGRKPSPPKPPVTGSSTGTEQGLPQQAMPSPEAPPRQATQQAAPRPASRPGAARSPVQQASAPGPVGDRAPAEAGPRPRPRPRPRPAPPPPEVVVVRVSPLTWYDVELAGTPALVALRAVDTPDGTLGQGFSIAPAAAGAVLAERAGDLPAVLLPGLPDGDFAAVVPIAGATFHVAVDPSAELAAASLAGAELRRDFMTSLVPLLALALACGVLVVLLIARAEKLARERSRFAAAAAHELRTPLAGLALYGDMLADGLGDPRRAGDYARRIADEAHRLGRVVGNVLGFTQLERGALAVSPASGDLAAALGEVLDRARPALDHAGVTLVVEVPEHLAARFDPDALGRIVQNLIDNAEKYGRGRPRREISLAARASGEAVLVSVTDDGPGVPREMRRRLFRPFARGAATDGPAGLGLGLALSRALARAMGGELGHADRPGGGAIFTLRLLPADQPSAA